MINFQSITDWELLGYDNTVDILNFSIPNSPINEKRKFYRLSTYFDNLKYTSNVKIQIAFGMLLTEASRGARYWRASSNNAYLYDNPITINSKISFKKWWNDFTENNKSVLEISEKSAPANKDSATKVIAITNFTDFVYNYQIKCMDLQKSICPMHYREVEISYTSYIVET